MHDFFHLENFFLDFHQGISFGRVLPLLQELVNVGVGELAHQVGDSVLVHARVGGKVLSEVEDEVVQKEEGRLLRVLVVSDGSRRYSVGCRPAVTISDVLLESGGGLVAGCDPPATGVRKGKKLTQR